jgi:hypothetical protein
MGGFTTGGGGVGVSVGYHPYHHMHSVRNNDVKSNKPKCIHFISIDSPADSDNCVVIECSIVGNLDSIITESITDTSDTARCYPQAVVDWK